MGNFTYTQIGRADVKLQKKKGNLMALTETTRREVFIEKRIAQLRVTSSNTRPLPGDLVIFTAETNGSNPVYHWHLTGGGIDVETKSNETNIFEYEFNNGGKYTLVCSVENGLSMESSTIIVGVDAPINGLYIEECCNYAYQVDTRVTLTANVDNGTNVEYNWTVGVVEQSSNNILHHTFSMPDIYDVGVTAQNSLSRETEWIKVTIEALITQVAIQYDPFTLIFEDEPVMFTAEVTGGSPASHTRYVWKINGTEMGERSENLTVPFGHEGEKEVSVQVYNNVSMEADSVLVQV